MIMLSVIIPIGEHAEFAEAICRRELQGLQHEVIRAANWQDGLLQAQGEFVSFLEPRSRVSRNYFKKNMKIFTSQPLFRKLVMVASSVNLPDSKHNIYGYLLSLEGSEPSLLPSRIMSSREPYSIQIGYIPGAILRRSVLQGSLFVDDPVETSIRVSLDFWQRGWRLLINPNTVYSPRLEDRIDLPRHVDNLPDNVKDLAVQFKREMIG